MKHIALWGPSEHASEADERRLATRLEALGVEVERLPRGAAPPADAQVVVINTKQDVRAPELAALPSLELVVTTTSGYDHIDLEACRQRGVLVARCPLARRGAVVETSIAMGLGLLRRLPEWTAHARNGRWVRREVKARSMPAFRDVTVGILGVGVIGAYAIESWRALGTRVLAHDPTRPDLRSLDEVLTQSDLVTLHCSLTSSSQHLVDAATIARMKRGAIVLNTARGECVDLPAAIAALREDRLGGLGLDVFEPEPPPELATVATLHNVLLSPHSAGYFDGLNSAIEDEVVATTEAFLASRPLPGLVVA